MVAISVVIPIVVIAAAAVFLWWFLEKRRAARLGPSGLDNDGQLSRSRNDIQAKEGGELEGTFAAKEMPANYPTNELDATQSPTELDTPANHAYRNPVELE